jgi:hypothetical protein
VPDETSFVDTNDLTRALAVELETWRKRMFRRLMPARDHFPELYRLATDTEPPTVWAARDYPPIRTFLIQALDHAEQVQDGGHPLGAYSPVVFRCIFGLTDETINATVRERQRAASALIPDLYTHYEMTEPEVRGPQVDALIAAVLGWHQARHAAAPRSDGQPGGPGSLYGRDADLTWLGQTRLQLKDTGGLFGIWGLQGIGKTVLAERFAWIIGPERTATIRVGNPGHYAEDLRATLTRAGHAVPDASPEQYEAAFRRYGSNLGDLWLLILDGVTGPDDIDRLGIDQARIPVLVVADERFTAGHDQPGRMPWRHIGPLDPDASVALLTQYRSDFGGVYPVVREDLEWLAALAGGHAATLDALSRLLPGLSEDDFWQLMNQSGRAAGDTLASVSRFVGDHEQRAVDRPLSWIVRNKLAQLADEPLALALLTILVSCSDSGQLPREVIDAVASEMLGRQLWSRELDFAYDRLAQLGLAARQEETFSAERLVCHLTRVEVSSQIDAALLAYERIVGRPVVDPDPNATPLDIRRKEYATSSRPGDGDEDPLPVDPEDQRMVCLDDEYWAHYRTALDGQRHVMLYHNHDGLWLQFSKSQRRWVDLDQRHDHVPVMIGWCREQVMVSRRNVPWLELWFGDDHSRWPRRIRDAFTQNESSRDGSQPGHQSANG